MIHVIILLLFSDCRQKSEIIELNCPQQTNSYDCGVYTILFALEICRFLEENQLEIDNIETWKIQLSSWLQRNIVPNKCSEMRTMIKEFAKTQINMPK